MSNLQRKATFGVFWRLAQTFCSSGFSFFITLFLTRMLSPSDYGLIGMLTFFIAVSQAFVDCGFGQALIRKINRTHVDESTVFYFNLGSSLICYSVLFIAAPYVADFYRMPILCNLLRVLSITLVLGALSAIQSLLYTIKLDFRTPMIVALCGNIISGIAALVMASLGYGVWSLVAQQIIRMSSITIIYYTISSWRPMLAFSIDAFKEMFLFGSRMLGSNILYQLYTQINKAIIGKLYSATELGLYSKSQELVRFPCDTIYSTIQSVAYPVLCKVQSEKEHLISVYKRILGAVSFFVIPLMIFLATYSRDILILLFGERWGSASIFMTILCVQFMIDPARCLVVILFQVLGRTDIVLRLHFITISLSFIILIAAIPFGLLAICWGSVIGAYLTLFINIYYTKNFISYSLINQIRDILKPLPLALIAVLISSISVKAIDSYLLKVILGLIGGGGFYILIAFLLRMHELSDLISVLKNTIGSKFI
jgi:O-antigen/teichoic acid export membrane protein